MIQLLIISILVCARLQTEIEVRPIRHGWALALLPCLVGWALVHLLARGATRRMDATGSLAGAGVADSWGLASRVVAGACLGAALLISDWPQTLVHTFGSFSLLIDLLAVIPFLVMVVGQWASLYPIERRLREAILMRQLDQGAPIYPPPTLAQHLWNRTRFEILLILAPVILASLWHEFAARLPGLVGQNALSASRWEFVSGAISWLGLVVVMMVAPAILRAAWDLVLVGPGSLRELAEGMCRQYGVRVRGPYLWRTHGTLVNAAILGVAWPFRYLLFSDAMLDRFTPEQVEAVMAHEIAHVRERHILWIGLSLASAAFSLPWLFEPLLAPASDTTTTVLVDIALLLVLACCFGFVSRRFEWQADAFAVRHLSQRLFPGQPVIAIDASRIMVSTLTNVAAQNGISVTRFSFRHGSIATRCNNVMALAERPADRLWPDRAARGIKLVSIVLLTASLLAALFTSVSGAHP